MYREREIEEDSEGMIGNLKCHICKVALIYVKGYVKEVNEGTCYIHPCFRLKSKDNDHLSRCKCNTEGCLKNNSKRI
ncbi:hypothetical protein [Clostridium tetani]|uniref:hypothetical protein n=1 Tax=Clostridium tetani TaxID=1513 RepID=UPI0029548E09|nr:hypothetical protein [Clostridium tetani]